MERQRIDNMGTDIKDLDECGRKALPDIKKNSDELDDIGGSVDTLKKKLDNTNRQVKDNTDEIESIKNQNSKQDISITDVSYCPDWCDNTVSSTRKSA